MEEIREILQTLAQSTLATASAAEAVKKAARKAVEGKKSSTTGWSKMKAKPNIFDYKSQEEEIKAFRVWSWVLEKYLSAADETYMKDLKEIHEKPNDKFDMDLATAAEEDQVHQALWIVSFIDEGKSTAIGESCGGLQWI